MELIIERSFLNLTLVFAELSANSFVAASYSTQTISCSIEYLNLCSMIKRGVGPDIFELNIKT